MSKYFWLRTKRFAQKWPGLRKQLAEPMQQLQAALAQIAESEQRKPDPPAFVKLDRSSTEPQGPRKKWAVERNASRKRAAPTRIERHGLEPGSQQGLHLV